MTENERFGELWQQYYKRMYNKRKDKPQSMQILMNRTFGTAIDAMAKLGLVTQRTFDEDIEVFLQSLSKYEYTTLFYDQAKLVKADPEKFLFGLHGFYNDLISSLRKEHKLYEFGQFIGAANRFYNENKPKLNFFVNTCCLDLILQTFEYLRPDRQNLEVCTYGISLDGELLTGPYPYPYSDVPSMHLDYEIQILRTKKTNDELRAYTRKLYQKYGMDIRTNDDFQLYEQAQRVHINTTNALFPFINEYTFDIAISRPLNSLSVPFMSFGITDDRTDTLLDALKVRRYTLPTNGVEFIFDDVTGELNRILLKEIVVNDSVHVLYRLDTDTGSLGGFYEPNTTYLFSALSETAIQDPYNSFRSMLLHLYASQVLEPGVVPDLNTLFTQSRVPLKVSVVRHDGPLKNCYNEAGENPPSGKLPTINGRIERLPATELAKEAAVKYGYRLPENEAYVPVSRKTLQIPLYSFRQ